MTNQEINTHYGLDPHNPIHWFDLQYMCDEPLSKRLYNHILRIDRDSIILKALFTSF